MNYEVFKFDLKMSTNSKLYYNMYYITLFNNSTRLDNIFCSNKNQYILNRIHNCLNYSVDN